MKAQRSRAFVPFGVSVSTWNLQILWPANCETYCELLFQLAKSSSGEVLTVDFSWGGLQLERQWRWQWACELLLTVLKLRNEFGFKFCERLWGLKMSFSKSDFFNFKVLTISNGVHFKVKSFCQRTYDGQSSLSVSRNRFHWIPRFFECILPVCQARWMLSEHCSEHHAQR